MAWLGGGAVVEVQFGGKAWLGGGYLGA